MPAARCLSSALDTHGSRNVSYLESGRACGGMRRNVERATALHPNERISGVLQEPCSFKMQRAKRQKSWG